ncbi:hypothetical protein [Streptomyces olivochromogenes]|uniref:hypothetical protein n=1 Tax=Streptomyces olivochromogenes TaxID=1963 RepID=UPI0036A18C78
MVTERQAELLLGEGRHPDADRIERERLDAGKSSAEARRATVLGRPIELNQSERTEKAKGRSPWLAGLTSHGWCPSRSMGTGR